MIDRGLQLPIAWHGFVGDGCWEDGMHYADSLKSRFYFGVKATVLSAAMTRFHFCFITYTRYLNLQSFPTTALIQTRR